MIKVEQLKYFYCENIQEKKGIKLGTFPQKFTQINQSIGDLGKENDRTSLKKTAQKKEVFPSPRTVVNELLPTHPLLNIGQLIFSSDHM